MVGDEIKTANSSLNDNPYLQSVGACYFRGRFLGRGPACRKGYDIIQAPRGVRDIHKGSYTQSLKRVFTTTPRRYDAVHVLLVRWEDDDLGTETEINDLDKIFRETYHYSTECRTIPTDDAFNSLECTVVNFRQKNDSPDNLLIFYYGGHGVGHGAHNAGNESIWTA
jgi:hypothetical protein